MTNEESVTRYVVTHVSKNGTRTLAHPAQGRFTYATEDEALRWIMDALFTNGEERLKEIYGLPLEVRPVSCWPGHFDPKTVWFDK